MKLFSKYSHCDENFFLIGMIIFSHRGENTLLSAHTGTIITPYQTMCRDLFLYKSMKRMCRKANIQITATEFQR